MITVNLPDGNKAEFPDNMSQEQIQNVLQKQFPAPSKVEGQYSEQLPTAGISVDQFVNPQEEQTKETQRVFGSPNDPNFDPSGLEPWQYKGGLVSGIKAKPNFLKKVEDIVLGTAVGGLNYTARLLGKGEREMRKIGSFADDLTGEKTDTSSQTIPAIYNSLEERLAENAAKYEGSGFRQGLGTLSGEVAATALPFTKGLKVIDKLARTVGKYAGTAAKYGTSGAAGATLLSGMQGLKYNPEDPDSVYSTEQFAQSMKSPISYLAPMAGTAISSWADKARKLNETKKIFPSIRARDVDLAESAKDAFSISGPSWKQIVFDSIPNLTGRGKGVEFRQNIGEDLYKYINKLAGNVSAKYSGDYQKIAGQEFHKTLQNLKAGQKDVWNKVPKAAKVQNPQEIKDLAIQAQEVINEFKLAGSSKDYLTKGIRGELTVDGVKNLMSTIGKFEQTAYKAATKDSPILKETADALHRIKKEMLEKFVPNLSGQALKDFRAAQAYTRNYYDTINMSTKVKNALYDEIDARNLIKSLTSEAEVVSKSAVLGKMSQTAQKATLGMKLAKAVENSVDDATGAVNIGAFIKNTAEFTKTPELMGKTYQAINGIHKYLRAIQQSGKPKMPMWLAGIGLTAGTAGAATGVGIPALITGVISYGAMASIANHSRLKSLFSLLTNKLSDSAQQSVMKNIESLMVRGGYFLSDDGSVDVNRKEQGNINLDKLPKVNNPDGSYSTVRTITIEEDGQTILLPTIINGKPVSEKGAINYYHKTGKHLGKFNSEEEAQAYDRKMHKQQGWTK